MKAEERKKLETNVLADRMGRLVTGARRGPSRRGILIWLLLIVVVIGGVVFYLWRTAQARTTSEMWLAVSESTRPALTKTVLKDETVQKTLPGKAARFQLASVHLWERGLLRLYHIHGTTKTVTPYPMAIVAIRQAKAQYLVLQQECEKDPVFGPEALYNLAVAEEALAIRDPKNLTKAREYYNTLNEQFKESAFAERAREHLKRFKGAAFQDLQEFYAELHAAYNAIDGMGEEKRFLTQK